MQLSRQGDIYHPDFLKASLHGYFDVTMCNSLHSSHIIKATTKTGSAADAAECSKDHWHEYEVTVAGGVFYPLVVETHGLWTDSSLKIIKAISFTHCCCIELFVLTAAAKHFTAIIGKSLDI